MNYADYHTLTINGERLSGLEITQFCRESEEPNLNQLGLFMNQWMSDKPFIELKTSGSTGNPKTISVEKNQMLKSAAMTAEYFDFKEGQTALLCLPVNYIAGKMMVVRALFSRLNLFCIEPADSPVASIPDDYVIDFAPLVPLQLKGVEDTKSISRILLGGSAIDPAMEESFQKLKAIVYHGYGMTETLSHVAIRNVNGVHRSEVYHALPGIFFDTDERNCLVIDVPFLNRPVLTNDVVELLNEREFIWLGRADNVVNSGGVKLHPEEIEKKLYPLIPEAFFFAGMPDARFGEKLCLFIENEAYADEQFQRLLENIARVLDKYEKPRDIFFIKRFKRTESGKIQREGTVRIVVGDY